MKLPELTACRMLCWKEPKTSLTFRGPGPLLEIWTNGTTTPRLAVTADTACCSHPNPSLSLPLSLMPVIAVLTVLLALHPW